MRRLKRNKHAATVEWLRRWKRNDYAIRAEFALIVLIVKVIIFTKVIFMDL